MASPTSDNCRICEVRAPVFSGVVCSDCRDWTARFILGAEPAEVAKCWRISEHFALLRTDTIRRIEENRHRSMYPRGVTLAAIAEGLRVSEKSDEALVMAAYAITLGGAADQNTYGASALRVLLSPELARQGLFAELRARRG
jgi:hypothetical protein